MQKGFIPIIILVGILVLASAGGAYYFFKVKTPVQKACTMDAKICPDESSVGRSGPNCEFAPCPQTSPSSTPDETANWKIYEDQENGFSFKYPNNWNIDNSYKSVNGSTRFFKSGDKVYYTYMMAKGSEQLIVAIQRDRSFDEIQQQLNISDSSMTIAGKKTLKYATGAYILLGPLDKNVLSVYMPQYPNDGLLGQILATFKFTN